MYIYTYIYTQHIYISTLVVTENWKLTRCPSTGEWPIKLWYLNAMKYYNAIENEDDKEMRKDLYAVI